MTRQLILPCLVLALSALAACSSSTPSASDSDAGTLPADGGARHVDAGSHPDAGTGGVTIAQFQAQLAQAICANEQKCLHDGLTDPTYCSGGVDWLNTDGVLSSPTSFDTSGAVIASVKAGQATFDGAQGQLCLDAIRALACDSAYGGLDSIQECVDAFTGNVMQGHGCIASLACSTGLICVPTDFQGSFCAATCQVEGTRCLDDSNCGSTTICDVTTHTCVAPMPAPGAAGQPCGAHNLCAASLGCFTQASGSGVCNALSAAGGPCTVDGLCQAGLRCLSDSTGTQACAKPLAPVAEGQPCDPQLEVLACANGEACVPNDDNSATFCQPLKTIKQDCAHLFQCGGEVSDEICDPASHTCVARPKSGACPAGVDGTCDPTAYCDLSGATPTCLPLKGSGVACGGDQECSSGSCNGTSNQCTAPVQLTTCMP